MAVSPDHGIPSFKQVQRKPRSTILGSLASDGAETLPSVHIWKPKFHSGRWVLVSFSPRLRRRALGRTVLSHWTHAYTKTRARLQFESWWVIMSMEGLGQPRPLSSQDICFPCISIGVYSYFLTTCQTTFYSITATDIPSCIIDFVSPQAIEYCTGLKAGLPVLCSTHEADALLPIGFPVCWSNISGLPTR